MDTTTRHPQKPVADGHPARRVLMILTAAAFVACSATAAQDSGNSLAERVALNGTVERGASTLRVTQSMAEPLATAGPLAPQDALRADRTQTARQTMVWADNARSGLGLGVGVEQRRPYGSAAASALRGDGSQPQMTAGLLVGASLATGPRSHLVVQTPLQTPQRSLVVGQDTLSPEDQQRQVRVGLVFAKKKPLADFKKGFQMELSGQSTLAVKPRGGKIGLAFQKVW